LRKSDGDLFVWHGMRGGSIEMGEGGDGLRDSMMGMPQKERMIEKEKRG
jgi:hypothetical protein